ncbi:MAG: hypothetical protein KIH89_002920 [Candidatus Shapirobacteria bacterium]|nr:hypothetical protein [Candidatus Shapirobacteria bacterium]
MFNLSLTPSQIEFVLKPGVSLTQAYQVTNESDQPVTLNTQVLPFLPSGDNGSVTYNNLISNPNINFSFNNADLKLGQPFVLQPQETRQIVLKITTSSQTSLADYYATIFIYQSPDKSANGTTISQTSGQIGSHILLSVSNTENPKAEGLIQKFSLTPKIKDVFFTPIKFSGQIKNNSNYFFKTAGKITISKSEKVVKELNLDSQNILANYYRQFSCDNQKVCTLSPPLWPGKYTATLEFDPNLNIPSSSVSFLVLPISPVLFLSTIFLLSFLFSKIRGINKDKI